MTADPRVAQTRRRVFDAVIEVLRSDGIDGVTHSHVAEVSGVGRATLYRHWPDTSALLVETILDQHSVARSVPEDLERLPLPEAAEHLVRGVAVMLRENDTVPAMLGLLARAEHDPAVAEVRRQVSSVVSEAVESVIRAAQQRGELSAQLDVEHAKAMLAGPLFFARLVLGDPMSDEQAAAHVRAWLRAVEHRPPTG